MRGSMGAAATIVALALIGGASCMSRRLAVAPIEFGDSGAPAVGGHDSGSGDGGGMTSIGVGQICAADADCGNPFLACVPTTAQATTGEQVTIDFCAIRYQRACRVDADCGPSGFICKDSICSETGGGPCASDDDCPAGWSCYAPCPCPGRPPFAESCHPPFAEIHCPVCLIGDAGQ